MDRSVSPSARSQTPEPDDARPDPVTRRRATKRTFRDRRPDSTFVSSRRCCLRCGLRHDRWQVLRGSVQKHAELRRTVRRATRRRSTISASIARSDDAFATMMTLHDHAPTASGAARRRTATTARRVVATTKTVGAVGGIVGCNGVRAPGQRRVRRRSRSTETDGRGARLRHERPTDRHL